MSNNSSAIPKILPVTCHTDYVGEGSTFVAIKGSQLDGISFIPLALQKGASRIVVEQDSELSPDILAKINSHNSKLIFVKNTRKALSELSAAAWGYPAKKLNIIGVTGTKGKTTTTFLLNHILFNSGYKTAMVSGVRNNIAGKNYSASLTTPLPDYIHAFLYKCVQEKVQFVILESSAQALSLYRLYGIEFSGIVFTNFDSEHAEFYSSMSEYFEAKIRILDQLKASGYAIINADDKWLSGIKLKDNLYTFSLNKNNVNYVIKVKKNDISGIDLEIQQGQKTYNFGTPNFFGEFNAYNLAGAVCLLLAFGLESLKIFRALGKYMYVPGRMEKHNLSNGAVAIIDYAHNASSFSQVLPVLKSISKNLIVVFGAGGDRDKTKRPIMGNIAASIADQVILTSDNPRSEDPQDIINQIQSGISSEYKNKVICEPDRAKAIKLAYSLCQPGDVIAILGKGPDEYQMVGNTKFFFSDKQIILNCQKSK